ncbi:MAG: dephospho-CoA kinase [Gemmatimonadaceae bacterium]|nr:dephospho-CoA kinase [Gemmatimonadaceae bacterium]
MTLLVGLTGNIASGKSSAAAFLAARGAVLVDSDVAAREAVLPGTAALAAVVARFGAGMLHEDGSLDRGRLGALVFGDPAARAALEAIVHPAVEASRQRAVVAARAAGAGIVVCDIPLLFEARLAWQFPRILLVDAPAPVRIARLVTDRGLSPAHAAARVAAQLPATLKRGRADLVVDNDGDRAALHARLHAAWQRLQAWAAVATTQCAA